MTKPKIHLFIDTNAFLSFFAYTNDDVEELRKLTGLIRARQLKLYLTEQVRDEFYRNREKKLQDTIAQFEKSGRPDGIPRFMVSYPQSADYLKALKSCLESKNEAIARARKEAAKGTLAADALFRELMKASRVKRMAQADYSAATQRMRRGNPPGKEASLGDRINWEILLRVVPEAADLHVVSKDGDFASPLDRTAPNGFLFDEWRKKKKATLLLYPEIKPLLTQHFPKIKLFVDVEKRAAMENLTNSGNFATTHRAIAELAPFKDALTSEEIEELIDAAKLNSQIRLIMTDEDLREFFEPLLELQRDNRRISDAEFAKLRRLFDLDPSEEGEE